VSIAIEKYSVIQKIRKNELYLVHHLRFNLTNHLADLLMLREIPLLAFSTTIPNGATAAAKIHLFGYLQTISDPRLHLASPHYVLYGTRCMCRAESEWLSASLKKDFAQVDARPTTSASLYATNYKNCCDVELLGLNTIHFTGTHPRRKQNTFSFSPHSHIR